MQNFDLDVNWLMDQSMYVLTNELTNEQKDENYILSAYFLCQGYYKKIIIWMTPLIWRYELLVPEFW